MAFMAADHGLVDRVGFVGYLIKMHGKVSRGSESVALYFLEAEREFLADVFNFVKADEITKIRGGVMEMVDCYS